MAKIINAIEIRQEIERNITHKLEQMLSRRTQDFDITQNEVDTFRAYLLGEAIPKAIETYEREGYTIKRKGWLKTLGMAADMLVEERRRDLAGSRGVIDTTLGDIENARMSERVSNELGTGMQVISQDPLASGADYNWAYGARGHEGSPVYGRVSFLEASIEEIRNQRGAFTQRDFGSRKQEEVERQLREAQTQPTQEREKTYQNLLDNLQRKYVTRNQTYELDVEKTLNEAGLNRQSPAYNLIREKLEAERENPEEKDKLMLMYAEAELNAEE